MTLQGNGFGRAKIYIEKSDDGAPGPSNSRPSAPASRQSGTSPAGHPRFDQSPLPAAMLAVAHHDSPENRRALYESMFETWFLVPIRGEEHPDTPGLHDIPPDIASSFSLEHDSAGLLVAVAFTDEEALRNWNKEILWIALQGSSFFQAVSSTEAQVIVINPFEPDNPKSTMIRPGGRVTRWEFEALAAGRHPGDQSAEEQEAEAQSVLVATPKPMPPAEIFTALATAAKIFPQVTAMYFAQLIYPTGDAHKAVAVEFIPDVTDEQLGPVMVALEKKAHRLFPRKETVDLLLVESPLGQSVARTGQKFYSATK
ncbi:MAG TPA: SseB family protein [Candidatus Angelobacter sp.]|nr:SseB family protein [Candidatus Angelobacter sp.]